MGQEESLALCKLQSKAGPGCFSGNWRAIGGGMGADKVSISSGGDWLSSKHCAKKTKYFLKKDYHAHSVTYSSPAEGTLATLYMKYKNLTSNNMKVTMIP